MGIYDLIADNYSKIFPPDDDRLRFIKSIYPIGNTRILDTGCATGDIAIELAKSGYDVTGIDLNARMINIAKSKIDGHQLKIEFHVMDMLDINRLGMFNLILCFGNTLPHLQSETDVGNFFNTVHTCLQSSGTFIFQILNYDKILSEGRMKFQIIEGNNFIFRRNYDFPDNGKILFKIEFEDKGMSRIFSDSADLLPLRQKQLLDLLNMAGFNTVSVYSDYNMTKSNLQEYASIYVAWKSE